MNYKELCFNILDNLQDGVYYVDQERRILFWNKAAERITGYSRGEVNGQYCQNDLLKHIDEKGTPLCVVGCPLFATLGDGDTRSGKVFLRHKEGHRVPIQTKIFPVLDGMKIIGAVEIFTLASSCTYEDSLISDLEKASCTDTLTGLPNRRFMENYLQYVIELYHRFDEHYCVLFLDVDNFRKFNNDYGHDVGDLVLRTVAKSITGNLRADDRFGRWGGEELLGVLPIKSEEEMRDIGERVRILIANTEIPHEQKNLQVTVSIGITALWPEDDMDSIVKRADDLMYESKKNGKNQLTVGYSYEMQMNAS